jgi:hypothetical protein
MASVLGMLEERETAARVRVEGLREEAARSAGVLEAAGIELDRRVIAREELVEALAASAAETTAVSEARAQAETAPAPVPGSVVPPWGEGLPVTVLTPDYQRILGVLEERQPTDQGPPEGRTPMADQASRTPRTDCRTTLRAVTSICTSLIERAVGQRVTLP